MRKITFDELLAFHDIALTFGGIHGIKNESLLYSAIENPFTTMYGEELYSTDELKIAMTLYSLIKNHGFEDANKRTALFVFKVLLEDCDIELNATEDEYIQLALDVEQSYDKYDIENWINNHKLYK